jgi:hypothetical protein
MSYDVVELVPEVRSNSSLADLWRTATVSRFIDLVQSNGVEAD